MREEFKRAEWRDFRQRYEGTFGWYQLENGKEKLVKLAAVGETQLTFTDETGFAYTAVPDRGNVFRFIPVERGMYNIADDVVFCERVPARQWHRGMCSANTTFASMLKGTAIKQPTFPLLEQIFNPPKGMKTPKDSFLKDLEGAAALNQTFSIIKDKVYCYDHLIGSYKKGLVTLKDRLFVQELSDIMRDQHLPITVEVK